MELHRIIFLKCLIQFSEFSSILQQVKIALNMVFAAILQSRRTPDLYCVYHLCNLVPLKYGFQFIELVFINSLQNSLG